MARIRLKLKKRVLPERPRQTRLWFRLQPNGKITVAEYIGNERINFVKPFELSMWRQASKDIVKAMILGGWPERLDVKFLWEVTDPITTDICQSLLDQCNLLKRQWKAEKQK